MSSTNMNKLKSALQRLRVTVDKNKEDRKKCNYGNDDILLEKNLFAFLEDLINSIKKLKIEILPNIEQGLVQNETLSKELIIEKLKSEINSNSTLSAEAKQKVMRNLENEEAREDIYNIIQYKNEQFNLQIQKERELMLLENPNLDKEKLQNLLEAKLEDNQLRPSDIFEATRGDREFVEHTPHQVKNEAKKESINLNRQTLRAH